MRLSSSGRRRPGPCRRTSPRRSSPTPSTVGARTGTGSRPRGIRTTGSTSVPWERSSSASLPRTIRRPRPRCGGGPPVIRGTTSRSRRGPASSTSRPARARRTSSSAASTTSRCCRPSTRPVASTTPTAGCTGSTTEAADQIVGRLAEQGFLLEAGAYLHRYPHCWRCDTPLIWRVTDDWLISVEELRQSLLDANATVEWTPAYMGKRMDDWLRNMGDWNISRRRYYGLPLPFYPCECGHLNVVGSKAELLEGPVDLPELRRPWIDAIRIRCEVRQRVERIPRSATSGSTRGSCRSRRSAGRARSTCRRDTRRSPGADAGRPARPCLLGEWFPADWVSEMREQIRLWFYSQLFMSVVLTGRAPFRKVLGYEKMLDEKGREMHSSWGNTIDAPDAFARMGADVMRWQFCAQPPNQNLLFGFGPAHEIKEAADALELGIVLRPVRRDRGLPPIGADLEAVRRRPAAPRPLAPRAHEPARRGRDAGSRGSADPQADRSVRRVRRRPLELVHPALPPPLLRSTRPRSEPRGRRSRSRSA